MKPAQACSSMRWPPERTPAGSSASGSSVASAQQLGGARLALAHAAGAAGREERHEQVLAHAEVGEHARHLERAHETLGGDAMRGRPVMSVPSRRTLPASGVSMPVSRLTKVVLPAPLGPMRPRISPGASVMLTSLLATRPP